MISDIKKFSFAEMFSNSNGKTSASGVMGVLICTIGAICFLGGSAAMVFKETDSDILVQSIAVIYAGALLLGYRKSTEKTDVEITEEASSVESSNFQACSSDCPCKCHTQMLNS